MDGLFGLIVDDSIGAATKEFIEKEDQALTRFIMNPKQFLRFNLSGMKTLDNANMECEPGQREYPTKIEAVRSLKPNKSIFARTRGKIAWCALSTRADVASYLQGSHK